MSIFDQKDETDYLKELTQPGGKYDRTKYASDEEMYKAIAKGKIHADKTLEVKLQEFDQLREDALRWRNESTSQAKFEELVNKFESRMNNNNTNDTDGVKPTEIDFSKIEELASQKALATYKQLQQEEKENQNLAKVESRIRERIGDNPNVLRDKMNSLGLSSEDVKSLAKRNPEAVIAMLGLHPQQPPSNNWAPISSNVRSDTFKPDTTYIRDAVYYEKLRKENPKEYYSEKTSVQRLKDMDHPDFMKRMEEQVSRSF